MQGVVTPAWINEEAGGALRVGGRVDQEEASLLYGIRHGMKNFSHGHGTRSRTQEH